MHPGFLRFILSLSGLLAIYTASAQDSTAMQGFGIEANLLSGRIIRHKITAPIPQMSSALDVNFVWQTYGNKDWQQRRNFPMIGIGITGTDYGNSQVFGYCIGIYPNLQIPLIRSKNLEWTFRLGDGLGYVTRKYQTTAPVDTLNTAIGSHLNDFAIFMTDLRYSADDHWQFQFGANFTHISDADYHQPNLGINMAGLHFGVRYFPVSYRPDRIVRQLPKLKNQWLVAVRQSISYKEARTPGGPELPTYITAAYVSRRWLSKNKLYLGADYAFHNDTYEELKYWGFTWNNRAHAWDGAIFAGNEFLVGRLGLITQVGVYYKQTYLKNDPVYEKIGGNFYIFKKETGPLKELFLSAILLTHGIVAELSEFGIGAGF